MTDNKISRRTLLQAGATGLFGFSLAASPARGQGETNEQVDAVIVGSGFGGAIAALRLGQAGVQTVVLERGRRWAVPDKLNQNVFSTARNPDGRSTWLSPVTVLGDHKPIDIYTGILDAAVFNGINVARGAGVGGGSLCYAGIHYQPKRNLFDQVFQGVLNYDQFASVYYPRVAQMFNNPQPIPADILASSYYQSTRFFLQEGAWDGLNFFLLPQNINWDIVRQEIAGTRAPSAINGEFWYGDNSGCKFSLDQNYLLQAEETGHVDILPLHVVNVVNRGPGGQGYTVRTSQIDTNGVVQAARSFTCKYLFLSAGSTNTPQLLVKAKATGQLPALNQWTGQLWGSNGDTLTEQLGLTYTQAGNPGAGGPAGGVIEDHSNPLGPVILEPLAQFESPFDPVKNTSSMFFLAMGLPPAVGSFAYSSTTGKVTLTWPGNDPGVQKMVQACNNSMANLNAALNKNGVMAFSPPVMTNLTAHPLGGMVLGKACDRFGRVLGYQNLYVVDGSLIPGSAGCTNPAFTVAAVAEHCMDDILLEDIF